MHVDFKLNCSCFEYHYCFHRDRWKGQKYSEQKDRENKTINRAVIRKRA